MNDHDKLELYQKAMEFAKHKKPNGGLGNIYVARTIDKQGNVTSETYGMNMFTEYGFVQYFGNANANWPRYLYVGDSEDRAQSQIGSDNEGGHSLFSYYTQEHDADSLRNTTIDYKYPMYYYPILGSDDGIVTCVCKFQTSFFDFTVAGAEQEFNITEYGIGSDTTHLWTHSWVYDKTGRYATIIKRPQEQLEITVFFCMSYKKSIITNGWANGRHTVITTLQKFLGYRMGESSAGTYRRFNTGASTSNSDTGMSKNNTASPVSGHAQTKYCNLNAFNMSRVAGLQHGYFDGFFNYTSGFVTVEPQVLTEAKAEQFDVLTRTNFFNFEYTSISDRFGENSAHTTPFTQADITGVYLYDRFQGDYLNSVGFDNDKNHWYTETPMQSWLYCPIYYTDVNDMVVELFVYQNIHPEDPIEYFNNTTIQTIMATDAYWDRSTWEMISNPFNIPNELKTKRYYITSSNSVALNPVRKSIPLTMIPNKAERKTYAFNSWDRYIEQGAWKTCENYNEGYFVKANTVFIPSTNGVFQIGPNSSKLGAQSYYDEYIWHFCYGRTIMTFNKNGSPQYYVYITNLDSLSEPYSVTYYLNGDNGFTNLNNGNVGGLTYKTESATGLVCLQQTNADECVVVDLTQKLVGSENNYYKKLFQSRMACAIYNTQDNKRRIAYVPSDELGKLRVFDFTQNTDIAEFNLPTENGDITMIWALNDYIWATNGSSWCYQYKLGGDSNGTNCANVMTLITNRTNTTYVKITAVDDVIMVYRDDDTSIAHCFYTRTDERQNTIFNLSDFQHTVNNNPSKIYFKLKYIENGKTLALLVNYVLTYYNGGAHCRLIDFGQYLNPPKSADGPVVNVIDNNRYDSSGTIYPAWITYGEHLICGKEQYPISLMLQHRLVGKTRIHSTVNTIKHVGAKQFSVTYTNSPPGEWSEDAPGYPPGVLN